MTDAARIRKILDTYGVGLPASEVKRLVCTPRVVGPKVAMRLRQDPSLSVKIAQEQRKIFAAMGIVRKGKGRRTKAENQLIAATLRVTALEKELQTTSEELKELKWD